MLQVLLQLSYDSESFLSFSLSLALSLLLSFPLFFSLLLSRSHLLSRFQALALALTRARALFL